MTPNRHVDVGRCGSMWVDVGRCEYVIKLVYVNTELPCQYIIITDLHKSLQRDANVVERGHNTLKQRCKLPHQSHDWLYSYGP